ncbi:ABC transporter permease [Actinoplanes teichomyceticus]|uniref:ABC-2 type transport system permease protein n=1 Tax=Actinoplanes teichomyceticus TaxID=1867 RepID=A0A561VKQ6_ACTTI|nr:ABC-2 family transporter protein [Actinoplanes teichomyceticus]TWG12215.1 ABC-2 type transport system permease protein [Actinoplanes teichomyceticus]GIF14149.1 membrane protein [Actinoplanes teichomyceticus]
MRPALRAYRAYLRAAVAMRLQYRATLLASAGVTLLWILLVTRVWAAAYQDRETVAGLSLRSTVVYLTLASLQAVVLNSPLPWIVAGRVRSGEVVFDVSRPLGYPGQMLALQAGQSLTQTTVMVLVTPLAGLLGGLSAPAGLAAGLLYPVALLLGWTLNALLSLLVALAAFWTVENLGISVLYRFVAAFLAGASVPLSFFPGPLRVLAEALPFRFVVHEPAAIYIGQIHGTAVLRGFALALAWIVLLAGLAAVVWRRAYRRIVVHGG